MQAQVQVNGSAGQPLVKKPRLRLRQRLPFRYREKGSGRINGIKGAMPGGGRPPDWTVEAMAKALRKSYGTISRAANYLRRSTGKPVTAATVRNYVKKHPELVEVIAKAKSEIKDVAEDKVYQIVRNDGHRQQFAACKLVLTTQAGWSRKTEITGIDGQPIQHKISVEFV